MSGVNKAWITNGNKPRVGKSRIAAMQTVRVIQGTLFLWVIRKISAFSCVRFPDMIDPPSRLLWTDRGPHKAAAHDHSPLLLSAKHTIGLPIRNPF